VGKSADYATFDEFEQYIRTVSAPFGPLTDAQWRHLAQTNAKQLDNGRWGSIYDPAVAGAFAGPIADVVLWPYWDAVRCETLVLRGGDSDLLLRDTAQEMTRRGPRARLVEFPGIGHAPMLMDAAQIRVVREFLGGGE
jgi:pimeloyl-ACP methyl ester carboxylesterase